MFLPRVKPQNMERFVVKNDVSEPRVWSSKIARYKKSCQKCGGKWIDVSNFPRKISRYSVENGSQREREIERERVSE